MEFLELLGYRGDFLFPLTIYVIENIFSPNALKKEVAEKIYILILNYNQFLMDENIERAMDLNPIFNYRLRKYKKQFTCLIEMVEKKNKWEILLCKLLNLNSFVEREIFLIFQKRNFSHFFIEKKSVGFSQKKFLNQFIFNEKLNFFFPLEKLNFILNLLPLNFNFQEINSTSFTECIEVNYIRLEGEYKHYLSVHLNEFIGELNKIFSFAEVERRRSEINIFEFFNDFYEMNFSPAKFKLPSEFYEEYILNEKNISDFLSEENRKNIQILFRFFTVLKYFVYKKYRGEQKQIHHIFKNISTVIYSYIYSSFDFSNNDIDMYLRDKLINSFLPSMGITKLFFTFFDLGIRFYFGHEDIKKELIRFIELGKETFSFDGRNIYLWGAFENY